MAKLHWIIGGAWLGVMMPLAAQADMVDCNSLRTIAAKENFKANPSDVQQCVLRGFDPPANWRPNQGQSKGVRVSGASGINYGTVQAPQNSPGAVGAKASVGGLAIKVSCKFTAKISTSGVSFPAGSCLDFANGLFKDKNNQTVSGVTAEADVTSSCPVESDTTGLYGTKQSLSGGGVALTCGGTMPTSIYETVMNRNATNLATTENGAFYVWLYSRQGNAFTSAGANPIALPTYLCREEQTENGVIRVKSVDLNPPVSQIIMYNPAAGGFMIHLIPKSERATTPGSLAVDTDPPQKYLLVPMVNGRPYVPVDCDLEVDYYRDETTLKADIFIEPAVNQVCENATTFNNAATDVSCTGANASSEAEDSCDTLMLFLTGTANGTVCTGKTQYAVLDRANIVYPIGSSPNLLTIADHTGLLAPTGTNLYYAQSKTILNIWNTAPNMTMNEGGTIGMLDNSRLVMGSPATFSPASGQVTMTGGGQLVSAGGKLLTNFPVNTTYTLTNPILPYRVQLGRSITFPEGYFIPTQPSPYVRLPMDAAP